MSRKLAPFVIALETAGNRDPEKNSLAGWLLALGPFGFARRISEQAAKGHTPRLWLAKPAGHVPNTRFPADDLLEARNIRGSALWAEDLPAALAAITNTATIQELIVHIGSPDRDPDFQIRERAHPGAWLQRWCESVAPYLLARCSVCIDAGGDVPRESATGRAFTLLRTLLLNDTGPTYTRLYMEPRPQRQLVLGNLAPLGVVGVTWDLYRANPDIFADAQRSASDEEIGGEVIVVLDKADRKPPEFPMQQAGERRADWLCRAGAWSIRRRMTPAFQWWNSDTDADRDRVVKCLLHEAQQANYVPSPMGGEPGEPGEPGQPGDAGARDDRKNGSDA